MIIAMLTENGIIDQSTTRATSLLVRQYPNDTVQVFSEKQAFLFDQNAINLDAQKLPSRITFIGHSNKSIYGIYNAIEFSNRLIAEINEASKIDPRMRTAIKAIDLLGCETGFFDEKGRSYAQIVSDQLFSAGFIIRVNAFTNLTCEIPHLAAASVLFNPDRLCIDIHNPSVFVFGLMRSMEDYQQFYNLIKIKHFLYQTLEFKPAKEFYDSLKQLKLKWDTQEITSTAQYEQEIILLGEIILRKTPFESVFKNAPTLETKITTLLYHFNLNNIISEFPAGIPNTPVECIEATLQQLTAHYQKIEKNIEECTKKQEQLTESTSITDNPRWYFDTTLTCAFTPTQMKVKSQSKAISQSYTPLIQSTHSIACTPSSFYNRKTQTTSRRQPAANKGNMANRKKIGR